MGGLSYIPDLFLIAISCLRSFSITIGVERRKRMDNEEKKDSSIIRLEERTSALERFERRHYLMEMILIIAFLVLTLVVVASCDVRIPEKTQAQKEWVYTEKDGYDNLSFTVNEDGESLTAHYGDQEYILEKNDTTDIVSAGVSLSLIVEEGKITVLDEEKNVIGFFEYR